METYTSPLSLSFREVGSGHTEILIKKEKVLSARDDYSELLKAHAPSSTGNIEVPKPNKVLEKYPTSCLNSYQHSFRSHVVFGSLNVHTNEVRSKVD